MVRNSAQMRGNVNTQTGVSWSVCSTEHPQCGLAVEWGERHGVSQPVQSVCSGADCFSLIAPVISSHKGHLQPDSDSSSHSPSSPCHTQDAELNMVGFTSGYYSPPLSPQTLMPVMVSGVHQHIQYE